LSLKFHGIFGLGLQAGFKGLVSGLGLLQRFVQLAQDKPVARQVGFAFFHFNGIGQQVKGFGVSVLQNKVLGLGGVEITALLVVKAFGVYRPDCGPRLCEFFLLVVQPNQPNFRGIPAFFGFGFGGGVGELPSRQEIFFFVKIPNGHDAVAIVNP